MRLEKHSIFYRYKKQVVYPRGHVSYIGTNSLEVMQQVKTRRKKMSVDRSYSPYEVIRAYHDRGMMKWGAFATGELTEAQNSFEKEKKEDKIIQALPHHLVLHLLNQSFSNQVQIKIQYQAKDKLTEVYGNVSEFINNQVRVKSTDKIYLISIEQIINIS